MKMSFTDGTPDYEWKTILPDMIAWETHARQNKLPMTPEAGETFPRVTYTAFLCFAAMSRDGLTKDRETFASFITRCGLPVPDDDDDDDTTEDPT